MRVLVIDDVEGAVTGLTAVRTLDESHTLVVTANDGGRAAAEAEALVLIRERSTVDAAFLERFPLLRLIVQTGGGTAHVDLAACAVRGVTVCTGGGSPVAPAEHTFGLILAAARRIPEEDARIRRGGWGETVGVALHGRTLGLLGYGRIGALVASYGVAFGMHVLVGGRASTLERGRAAGHEVEEDTGRLFERADVLSLHLRLTEATLGLVSADLLGRLRPEAILVNTARAGLVAPGALLAALRAGRPGMAALDVFDDEPLGADDPLRSLPNVVLSPHRGYVERDTYELYFGRAFELVNRFAEGRPEGAV